MTEIEDFLEQYENWLARRILHYARGNEYTAITPPWIDGWAKSIQWLTKSIGEGFKRFALDAELHSIEEKNADPLTDFCLEQIKEHRKRGISLAMFLGLLKYYRQSYQDLLSEKGQSIADKDKCARFIDQCFDRIELALGADWNEAGSDKILEDLQSANRELTNKKNVYRTLFESLPDPAILLDAQNRIIELNHSAACLVSPASNPGENYFNHVLKNASRRGLVEKPSIDSCVGKTVQQVFPWLSESFEKARSTAPGNGVFECEKSLVNDVRHFEISFSEMLDTNDTRTNRVLILRDITDRKRAELELQDHGRYLKKKVEQRTDELTRIDRQFSREIEVRRESEQSLQASEKKLTRILDFFPDHVCIVGRSRKIIWCNRATKDTFGEDVTGRYCYELYKNKNEPCTTCVARGPNTLPADNERERVIIDSEGCERFFWCTTTVSRRDRSGAPVQILKICRDITERQQAERELRNHQRLIESVADATPDVIFIFDLINRHVIYSNRRVEEHLGYTEKELKEMGQEFMPNLLHPGDAERVERHLKECETAEDDEVFEVEFRMRTKSGKWQWYSIRDKVFRRDENGRGDRIIGIAHDISVRKEADERLMDYQQQLKKLTMELSLAEERERHHLIEALHDGIGQNLYALKMKLASFESLMEATGTNEILEEIQALINTTIDDARTLTFELNPPILYELGLPAAIDWLVGEYSERNHLQIRHESEMGDERLSDPVRGLSYRAVRELLLNIDKHAQADEVAVSTRCGRGSIVIEVRDNGMGFDPLILKGEKGKYAGFGLFNIRERLEQLGGGIQVKSGHKKGTTVILTIPQEEPDDIEEENNEHQGNADR